MNFKLTKEWQRWFLPRDAMHKCGLYVVSVCLCVVRLSRSYILSKRIKISSKFFTIM